MGMNVYYIKGVTVDKKLFEEENTSEYTANHAVEKYNSGDWVLPSGEEVFFCWVDVRYEMG